MTKAALRSRQDELDRFARKLGWTRGKYGSWRAGRLTISVIVRPRSYPMVRFIAVERGSGEERELAGLEDVDRFVDYVRATGQIPAAASQRTVQIREGDGRIEEAAYTGGRWAVSPANDGSRNRRSDGVFGIPGRGYGRNDPSDSRDGFGSGVESKGSDGSDAQDARSRKEATDEAHGTHRDERGAARRRAPRLSAGIPARVRVRRSGS